MGSASSAEPTLRLKQPLQPNTSASPSLRTLQSTLTPKAAAALVRERLDPNDLRVFLRSSPAKLLAMGALVIVACLLAGLVAASSASSRQRTLNQLLDETEPYAASAQQLYSSLSVADAAAATAFIAGGLEPLDVRDRYLQAVGEAAAELTGAAGSPDPQSPERTLLGDIATTLPVYTGIVEAARANNRSGYPVGAAYLAEASSLMQTRMLPSAEKLHSLQNAAVTATQRSFVQPPWIALGLLVLALLALALGQLYLVRFWHRVLNPGLILATVTMASLLVWVIAASWVSATATDRALKHGSEPLLALTESRILAQQARSDETLKLVRRDTTGIYDSQFDADVADLATRLDDFGSETVGSDQVALARAALDRWRDSHRRMNETLDRGDYVGASVVAIGTGPADSAAQFDAVDAAIVTAITDARDTLRTNVSRASQALDGLGAAALVLAVVTALLVLLGLWPRLREYR